MQATYVILNFLEATFEKAKKKNPKNPEILILISFLQPNVSEVLLFQLATKVKNV